MDMKAVGIGASFCVAWAFGAFAASSGFNGWIDPGTNTTVETAALWNDGENWTRGACPAQVGSTQVEEVKIAEPASGYRFIKLTGWAYPYNVQVTNWVSGTLPKVVIFEDSNGALRYMSHTAEAWIQDKGFWLYAPYIIGNSSAFRDVQLCNFVHASKAQSFGNGLTLRLDKWGANGANQQLVNRSTNGRTDHSMMGSGQFRIYAPESSATNNVSTWQLTTDSKIIRRTSAFRHALSTGAAVTGEGVSSGTYVSRIFPDDSVELSKTATLSGETELTFGAYVPDVYQHFSAVSWSGWGGNFVMQLNKYRADDKLSVEFNSLDGVDATWISKGVHYEFDTESGMYPGCVILHETSRSGKTAVPVILKNCEILFADSAGEYGPGFSNPGQSVTQPNGYTSTLCVTGGMTAVVTELQDWFGIVHKTGTGTLAVGMDKGSKVNASNKLYVDEGTVEIRKSDTSTVVIYTVGIASNAVLRLPTTSSVQFASLKPENGAILETPVVSDGAGGYTIKSISQYGGGTTQTADTETLVSLCGADADKLAPGSYPILMSCPLTSQDSDIKWKFVKRHGRRGRGTFHFGPHPTSDKCKALYLDYEIPGMILFFR